MVRAIQMSKEEEIRCQKCKFALDLSYYFDERDSDTGWECLNPKSLFYCGLFYPTDEEYWRVHHNKLKECKHFLPKENE